MDDDKFDDVYEGKFDLEDAEIEAHGVEPADSRVLDELVEGVEPEDVDVEGLIDVGLSYIEINRHEQALETFERALRFEDDNREIWVNKGYAHAEMEEYDRAVGAYEEALRISDSGELAAKAYANMAYAEHELGRLGEALDHVERALEIDDRLPHAWYNRGFFLNEQGDHDLALRSLDNALSLGMREPLVLEEKARALEGLERYDDARRAREKAEEQREERMREVMRE